MAAFLLWKEMQELKIQYNKQELSPEQETFNLLLERIETLNAAIAERKSLNETFNAARNKELLPLIQKIKDMKLRQVKMLDHLFSTRDFSKVEFRKLREEIIAQVEQIFEQFHLGSEDEDYLFALLAFHKGVSKDVTQAQYQRIELPEDDFEREEKVIPKSPEELKIAAMAKKSLEQIVQSIRSIYIPLVKKLHPDREPDEAEKLRKTEILKKLTEAYEKKDLLALLLLQAEYQIKQDEADKIKDLKSYNKILEDQVEQLEEEYSALYAVLGSESTMTEKSLKKLIKSKKKELNKFLDEQEELLVFVFSVPENLVLYLKH